jgi:tRNA(Ile)-lysidine synthetase-like protein
VRLPAGTRFAVRAWRPGDRMRVPGGRAARRVKRFLADARIPGPERPGWPVVYLVDPVGGEEIVWIPGVRLGAALLDPAPGPTQPHRCERHSDRR